MESSANSYEMSWLIFSEKWKKRHLQQIFALLFKG